MTKLYYWKVAKVFEATRIVKAQTGKLDFQSINKNHGLKSEGVKKIGFLGFSQTLQTGLWLQGFPKETKKNVLCHAWLPNCL